MANHFLSRIASFMGNKLGLSSEDEAVLLYGLEIVFSSSISFLLAIVLGIIFKVLAEVLMVIIAWFCLRQFAGGAHCSSMWRCALTSSLVPALLGLLAGWLSRYLQKNFILYLFALIFIAAVFITLRLAPADNPQKPVRSSRRRRRFRNLALAAELLLAILLLGAEMLAPGKYTSLVLAGALAVGVETFFLTPAGYRVMSRIDIFWGTLKVK